MEDTPRRRDAATTLPNLLPADTHLLPDRRWTSRAPPGLIFHNLILTTLYCDSLAAPSFNSNGAAPFRVSYKGPLPSVSCVMVKNALNFTFSSPLSASWSPLLA